MRLYLLMVCAGMPTGLSSMLRAMQQAPSRFFASCTSIPSMDAVVPGEPVDLDFLNTKLAELIVGESDFCEHTACWTQCFKFHLGSYASFDADQQEIINTMLHTACIRLIAQMHWEVQRHRRVYVECLCKKEVYQLILQDLLYSAYNTGFHSKGEILGYDFAQYDLYHFFANRAVELTQEAKSEANPNWRIVLKFLQVFPPHLTQLNARMRAVISGVNTQWEGYSMFTRQSLLQESKLLKLGAFFLRLLK